MTPYLKSLIALCAFVFTTAFGMFAPEWWPTLSHEGKGLIFAAMVVAGFLVLALPAAHLIEQRGLLFWRSLSPQEIGRRRQIVLQAVSDWQSSHDGHPALARDLITKATPFINAELARIGEKWELTEHSRRQLGLPT